MRCRFNDTVIEASRKTELFDSLVDTALKPLTENSREYFQIMDMMEMYIAIVKVIEELKSVVNVYAFAVNYNYYLLCRHDYQGEGNHFSFLRA